MRPLTYQGEATLKLEAAAISYFTWSQHPPRLRGDRLGEGEKRSYIPFTASIASRDETRRWRVSLFRYFLSVNLIINPLRWK
jgi:hypothetical protein